MKGFRLVQATNIGIISKGQTSGFLFKLTPSRVRREHDLVAGKVSLSSRVGYV